MVSYTSILASVHDEGLLLAYAISLTRRRAIFLY